MRRVTASVEIAAPISETWAVLKDLTAMREYMPGLKSVTITSQQTEGVGASRHCVFQDGVQLTERVVEWREA